MTTTRLSSAGVHLAWVLVAGGVLVAARCVPWQQTPFDVCTFRRVTGYPCPGCGGTRTFQAMAHGAWGEAFTQHPVAACLYLGVAAALAWHLVELAGWLLAGHGILPRITWRPGRRTLILAVLAVAANWVYRLAAGLR